MLTYHLDCDTCGFERTSGDEITAYDLAREHEADHPEHFVFIERGSEG